MLADPKTVLFLCTGNSARSILAEAILNRKGGTRYRAVSAGSQPKDAPNPYALALLRDKGIDTAFARSKSWDEFAGAGAPPVDLVITVCDSAAAETCPVWPGHPLTAHWGLPDPAAVTGDPAAIRQAFADTYRRLEVRIAALLALPPGLPGAALRERLREIGRLAL